MSASGTGPAFSTRLADGRTVGVNLGAGWTDGTGLNENGLCLDGKLIKLSEDVAFEYDDQDFMAPWKLTTTETDRVNLVFTPFFERTAKTDALVIRSEVHQMFGRFSGTVKSDSGEVYAVEGCHWLGGRSPRQVVNKGIGVLQALKRITR